MAKKEQENGQAIYESPPRRPVEEWRDALRTPSWLFAAAKAKYNWPVGLELSEVEYKKAIAAAENEVIR